MILMSTDMLYLEVMENSLRSGRSQRKLWKMKHAHPGVPIDRWLNGIDDSAKGGLTQFWEVFKYLKR